MKKELLLGLWMLASWATFAQEWVNTETLNKNDTIPVETVVIATDSTSKELAKTITFKDATRFMDSSTKAWEWVWIEPDPEWADTEELEPTDWWSDTVKEQESPTKFTISTWLWYSIWWKTYMSNRIAWSWQLFKWTKWELNAYAHIDYDDPMHSTWSWKVTLWKTIYKWLSLDWDYTFTWTGWNVVRLWLWYGWKIGEWQYAIKVFPLNTNWSPIAVKVALWTRVWENWQLSSFVFVDFGNNSYYWETEYAHRIAKWIALFAQARYWWIMDWNFTGTDSQKLVWWVKIDIK